MSLASSPHIPDTRLVTHHSSNRPSRFAKTYQFSRIPYAQRKPTIPVISCDTNWSLAIRITKTASSYPTGQTDMRATSYHDPDTRRITSHSMNHLRRQTDNLSCPSTSQIISIITNRVQQKLPKTFYPRYGGEPTDVIVGTRFVSMIMFGM